MSLSVSRHKEAVSSVGKCSNVGNPGSQGFFSTLPFPCVVVKKNIYIYIYTHIYISFHLGDSDVKLYK